MTPLLFALVALAGGAGAGLRWIADAVLSRVLPGGFPWAILLVNVTGSLALGVLTGASLDHVWLAVLGTGLLGGYTTFSTVAVDSELLAREGRRGAAGANAIGTLICCTAAAMAGIGVGVAA
ncbi:putative fluoride ion transporter CrcB [Microbacterium album]|uniref:Fluoride-specific ion channel FluC n=2 Tax=Microbacterium album TaxID=2053191 RepID=A0A917IEM0_9MICO|nr:putative fluoride ion transporter CrcB [Microbacterium album]